MMRLALAAALLLALLGASDALKVLVTGAAGRTGSLVLQQLVKAGDQFETKALVRTEKSGKKLRRKMNRRLLSRGDPKFSKEAIVSADVTSTEALASAMDGCDALVVCTSAVPKPKMRSILKFMWKKMVLRKADPGRPEFTWASGPPEDVDWTGQKNQFDAAVAAGVKHVVLVGSMGGTQKDNFLNSIGEGKDGGPGNILAWKRKAEKYLIETGLTYTIVHPGGLLNEKGQQRQLRVGVDDELLADAYRSIPRADVARVCVHALTSDKYRNRSFDLASFKAGEGAVTEELDALIDSLEGKNCDYGKTPELVA